MFSLPISAVKTLITGVIDCQQIEKIEMVMSLAILIELSNAVQCQIMKNQVV